MVRLDGRAACARTAATSGRDWLSAVLSMVDELNSELSGVDVASRMLNDDQSLMSWLLMSTTYSVKPKLWL